jgi:hypothetical protein
VSQVTIGASSASARATYVEIEVSEIGNRFGRAVGRHFTCTDETSEALCDVNIDQVGRMQLVLISKKACLDPRAERCLQEKFQQGRGIDHDHADSRSARMTTAAGVFKVTRFRL